MSGTGLQVEGSRRFLAIDLSFPMGSIHMVLSVQEKMMSRRKKDNQTVLNPDEIKQAATRMMAAAQAHQRASVYCFDKPDAKPPNIDAFFFPTVSFELILLSVEQSLRLLLLLHDGAVLDRVDHNPAVLYKAVRRMSEGKEGLRDDIICQMNALGESVEIDDFSEGELRKCLNKHDSSYSNFRYFQLNRQGKLNLHWELSPRDVQIMHCLSLVLISMNMEKMSKQGMQVIQSMSLFPQSEMTEELKDLVNGLRL